MRESVAVAKYSPDQGNLRLVYLGSGDDLSTAIVRGLGCPFTSGTHRIEIEETTGLSRVDLRISRRGKVFDLEAAGESGTALGMGMVDPEFQNSLLVSWWWGELQPAGIVKYVLGDEPDTIIPTYTSVMLQATGFDDVLNGRAVGSTTGGFPGTYSISYDGENGTVFGPFDWAIAERGGVLDLTWEVGGNRMINGFGFPDPESKRSIVVVYWGAGQEV